MITRIPALQSPPLVTLTTTLAVRSRLPAMSLLTLAGGGILPSSRRQRQSLVAPAQLPAVELGAHVTTQRHAPVFPLDKLAAGMTGISRYNASLIPDSKAALMNTSTRAIELLQQAQRSTTEARAVIDDLLAPHDYQDVATLVTQAAVELLEAAAQLMHSQDEAALDALGRADDLLDAVYDIIDGETDED